MKTTILVALLALSMPALANTNKSTAIRCRTEASCAIAWTKALQWVTLNSQYKVRLVNEYLIDTYGPTDYSKGIAFMVQRIASNGQIGIGLTTRCWTQEGIAGLFAIECDHDEQSYLDSFIKFLATEPPPIQGNEGSTGK